MSLRQGDGRHEHLNGPVGPFQSLFNIGAACVELARDFFSRSHVRIASFFGTLSDLEGQDVCSHIVVERLCVSLEVNLCQSMQSPVNGKVN